MKKKLGVLLFFIAFISLSTFVSAKGIPIPYSNGTKFITTQQLPDTAIIDGNHVNLGVSFEQFSVLWIPIWNYGETEYVLVTDDEKEAYELDEEDLAYVKESFKVDLDKTPTISFWNKIGGKIIWGAVLLIIIWGTIPKKKEDEEKME